VLHVLPWRTGKPVFIVEGIVVGRQSPAVPVDDGFGDNGCGKAPRLPDDPTRKDAAATPTGDEELVSVDIALGADKVLVLRHFLTRAARLFGPGLVLGLLGTFAASSLTRSMVFGVSALNPIYVASAVGAMIVVTSAAISIPVLRATRVNPVEALKAE
jgi:hypothetical protein